MDIGPQPTDRDPSQEISPTERRAQAQRNLANLKEEHRVAMELARQTKPEPLEYAVHLSRRMTLFLMSAAVVMLWFFGIEYLSPWGVVFDEPGQTVQEGVLRAGDTLTTTTTVSPGFTVAAIVVVLMSLLILWRLTPYLWNPPLLVGAGKSTLYFGTGWRYRPYPIPLREIESVEVRAQQPRFALFGVWGRRGPARVVGVSVVFKESAAIPQSLATSAGLRYTNKVLFIRKSYANQPPEEIANAIEDVIEEL